ncbi:hypothetical protein BR93DRAFT_33583 [Coniochaeta sp. PMI_546]|nr:hypothetical protein BR93DRAFT_33583 [Coniochaeta sp. PMI_546]
MGLPLWQPRVESDIPSRPEAKNPAHARSRIRGSSTRDRGAAAIRERSVWSARHGDIRTRERRRGLLQDMQERMVASNSSSSSSNNNPAAQSPRSPDAVVARHFNDRQQELEDFMGRVRSAYTEARPPPGATGGSENLADQLDAFRRLERETAGTHDLGSRASERALRSGDRMQRARAHVELARQQFEQFSAATDTHERAQRLRAQAAIFVRSVNESTRDNEPARSELGARAGRLAARVVAVGARVDGLGDRDRSLSPEGDNAWDTLLTTLTPDPQPPSVGSSFASIVSAVPSRTTANESSNTSMTGRDTGAEESVFDQPCDSDDEGEPVEFEVDLGDETNGASQQPAGAQASSYADVVRLGEYTMPGGSRTRNPPVRVRLPPYDGSGSGINTVNASEPGSFNGTEPGSATGAEPGTDDLILQLVGGLGGMQHIVRSLVRREDIPNDWWVDAGLSRTLPRDGSPNDSSNN